MSSAGDGAAIERLDEAAVADLVGSARIVALGESWHHTAQFASLRGRLLAWLGGLGFGTVLLEAVPPGPNALDDFLQGGPGTAAAALVRLGVRMWRNAETAAVFTGLRERPAGHAVCVRGIDVLTPGPVLRRILTDPRLQEATRGFDEDGRADQRHHDALPVDVRAELVAALETTLTDLCIDEHAQRAELGATVFAERRQDVLTGLRALRMLAASRGDWRHGLPLRDHAMAENVAQQVAAAPAGQRFVVLSHNSHVAAAPDLRGGARPMGAFLRSWFGDDYAVIGTTFGDLRFDPPIYGVTGPAPDEPDSIDRRVAAAGTPGPFVHRPAPGAGALRSPGGHAEYRLTDAFDGFVHVPLLTNAAQLVPVDLGL